MNAPTVLTETQMLDALFRGMNSSEYWLAVSVFNPNDMAMYLYPVNGSEGVDPQEREPLAIFTGSRASIMEQLIAYQMQERLS